jgi:hypothetical protein
VRVRRSRGDLRLQITPLEKHSGQADLAVEMAEIKKDIEIDRGKEECIDQNKHGQIAREARRKKMQVNEHMFEAHANIDSCGTASATRPAVGKSRYNGVTQPADVGLIIGRA